MNRSLSGPVPKNTDAPPEYIHWALAHGKEQEQAQFGIFVRESQAFDMDTFSEAIVKRIKDTEHIARKWQREAKSYRDKFHRAQFESQSKISFRSFREGDLALFLPTRNTAPNQRSWAAFNVGAPHYFLREQEFHRLSSRDWLLARISKIEERVVDLSRSDASLKPLPSTSSLDEDNPFGLSDGLRWYFLDAAEEKLGAPTTPGLGKTTVASANVDAAGSIQRKKEPDDGAVTRTLAKSLDSRRSSGNSRKSLGVAANPVTGAPAESSGLRASENVGAGTGVDAGEVAGVGPGVGAGTSNGVKKSSSRDSIPEEVRGDQLLGP
jgi:autophagy-related protein 11